VGHRGHVCTPAVTSASARRISTVEAAPGSS
jgi:hypothetical protein